MRTGAPSAPDPAHRPDPEQDGPDDEDDGDERDDDRRERERRGQPVLPQAQDRVPDAAGRDGRERTDGRPRSLRAPPPRRRTVRATAGTTPVSGVTPSAQHRAGHRRDDEPDRVQDVIRSVVRPRIPVISSGRYALNPAAVERPRPVASERRVSVTIRLVFDHF